ncbi:RNA polymerase sigma factor [Bacteroidota bacterium]
MRENSVSDQKLVSLYINGNEDAFEDLVERHSKKIFTTIKLIVKDNYVAEDLLQETFIKAINTMKTGRYNEEGKFLPWIMRIAHNLAIDYFRKDKRYPTILMEDDSKVSNTLEHSVESMEAIQVKKDTIKRMKELIQELPLSQKEVLVMRHYMKMSFQEIADTTGVSINTALGRMRYALINLRKKMKINHSAYDQNFYPE